MFVQRLVVSIILLPIGLLLIAAGGLPFGLFIALVIGLAAWEYEKLFRTGGYQPARILLPVGAALLVVGRMWNGFESAGWLTSLLVLAAMTYHLVAFERGRDQAGTDFAITISGLLYLGWIGGYLISLRDMPEGKWWFLVALPAVWLADSGAYSIGSRFGKHKFSPRLSPKKTWEGFWGGVAAGVLGGMLMAAVWRLGAGPDSAITIGRGALLGFVLAVLTPLGDLGESMFKRQVGAKDSSHLIPGHGGVLDRIDSWLWGGVLAFYIITWFFQ